VRRSKQQGSANTGLGSGRSGLGNTMDPTTGTARDHHLGRDATLAAGAGGLAYEAERHHGKPTQSSNITSNTRNPAGYDQAGSLLAGSGQQPLTGQDHHYGRDAGLGAGAGGLAYEAEKHHHKDHSGIGSTAQDQLAGSGHPSGHHYGRDAGLGAGAGGLAYEAEKHHHKDHSGIGSTAQDQLAGSGHPSGHHYGRDAGLGAGAGGLAYEAEKHHHKDHSGIGSTAQDQVAGSGHPSGRDHHLGRDAGFGAGVTGVDEHQKFRDTGRVDPGTNIREHQHPGASLATYPSPGYGNERDHQQNTGHHGHRKEEEALAGGAAAGGLAHHEHSKHDEKAMEKDEKHHEKERAKHMAAIEKDQKKHEHEAKKHEHDGEKKHGGLLGFLHKDKHDKHVDQPQGNRQVAHDRRGVDDETSTGTGAGLYDQPLEGPYGSQAGVHDSSLGGTGPSTIGSGATTHDAYGMHEGHNKLHKDPPAKILEARGQDYQGHSNVK